MSHELSRYYALLKDINNPIYYSIALGFLLFVFLFINYGLFYIPYKKRNVLEKKELKLKNQELEVTKKQLEYDHLKILADLSDTDPNPIIRVNNNGEIIFKNNIAAGLFGDKHSIIEILPNCEYELNKIIEDGVKIQSKIKIGKRYYEYYIRGINLLGIAQLTMFDLTTKMIYAKKMSQQRNKYKSLAFYIQDNAEKEKERIGRELHDSISQNLNLMKLKINNSLNESENYKRNFLEIDSLLDDTNVELRNIIFDLKPKIIEDLGLFNAVQDLSEHVSEVKKIKGSVDYIGEIWRFDSDTELYLFRIIQESLNNIIRHSEANEYSIQFIYSDKYLIIMISDNGHGFEPNIIKNSNKNGLLNMSERVKALNGKMTIQSSINGTILRINIPYKL